MFMVLLLLVTTVPDHRPSTIDHRPSTIDYRPSTIDHRPSTIDYRPSTSIPYDTVIVIHEWDVPWESSRPRDPYVAADGTVWFVGQRSDYVASLNIETGEFRRYDLPEGAGPHNLIVDDDGTVWYAGNRQAHIGRLDPETGEIEKIPMPDPMAADPHTLVFDQTGSIWFTVQGGNFIGHLDKDSKKVRLTKSLTEGSRPYGIVIDSKGIPWVALFGTNKLARVNPETMEITEVTIPRADARPRRIQLTRDNRVWYVDFAGGFLGVYDPKHEIFEEWAVPGGAGAQPYGMAVDDADRLWFVETGVQPNRFVGFDSSSRSFINGVDIPSGGGTIRHLFYRSGMNEVWFGTDANTVGRAVLP